MRLASILLGLLLITPLSAAGAGFAKDSLFLSKSPVTEGETVFIHAVVANETGSSFVGNVIFKDGETRVGAVAVTLPPGGAQAVSVSWQPTGGSHKVTAELTNNDGMVAESENTTFVVQEKPVAEGQSATTTSNVESSTKIQEKIASISPEAAGAAAPIFGAIDSFRQKGVEALTKGEEWAKSKSKGDVAGESTETSGIATTVMGLVATLLTYLIATLKYLLSHAGIFYPVFAIAFFYILWRIFKRMRRPSYG